MRISRGSNPAAEPREAGEYIASLPTNEHAAPEWQAAMNTLILVAENGGPIMFVRIGVVPERAALGPQAEDGSMTVFADGKSRSVVPAPLRHSRTTRNWQVLKSRRCSHSRTPRSENGLRTTTGFRCSTGCSVGGNMAGIAVPAPMLPAADPIADQSAGSAMPRQSEASHTKRPATEAALLFVLGPALVAALAFEHPYRLSSERSRALTEPAQASCRTRCRIAWGWGRSWKKLSS